MLMGKGLGFWKTMPTFLRSSVTSQLPAVGRLSLQRVGVGQAVEVVFATSIAPCRPYGFACVGLLVCRQLAIFNGGSIGYAVVQTFHKVLLQGFHVDALGTEGGY